MTEPLASWQFNQPKDKAVLAPAHKEQEPVPALINWHRKYSSEDEERHGFRHTTAIGEYHLSPVKTKSGMHVGYHLMFANNGKSKLNTEGMWSDLGLFTHPGHAVARAKKHYSTHSAGLKLDECDCSGSAGKVKQKTDKSKPTKFKFKAKVDKNESVYAKVARIMRAKSASVAKG